MRGCSEASAAGGLRRWIFLDDNVVDVGGWREECKGEDDGPMVAVRAFGSGDVMLDVVWADLVLSRSLFSAD